MKPASIFHQDLADGPPNGAAWCVTAEDGTKLRAATWAAGQRGTVLLFQGRNEHLEKYGRAARSLAERGYATATIDWRGQGLSERYPGQRISGHVNSFRDYQKDVTALLDTVRQAGLPEPYHLIAHSMGGAIGLRALSQGLPVQSAAFSAPMWGIMMSAIARAMAPHITGISRKLGLGLSEVPVGPRDGYLMVTPFEENHLTHDREMYDYMTAQALFDPRLAVGRPTLTWLSEALREVSAFGRLPPPSVPVYVGVAGEEAIVENDAIHRLTARWPNAVAEIYDGARHEIMMATPPVRSRFFDTVAEHFEAAT